MTNGIQLPGDTIIKEEIHDIIIEGTPGGECGESEVNAKLAVVKSQTGGGIINWLKRKPSIIHTNLMPLLPMDEVCSGCPEGHQRSCGVEILEAFSKTKEEVKNIHKNQV